MHVVNDLIINYYLLNIVLNVNNNFSFHFSFVFQYIDMVNDHHLNLMIEEYLDEDDVHDNYLILFELVLLLKLILMDHFQVHLVQKEIHVNENDLMECY
jgi:hypothetical protein